MELIPDFGPARTTSGTACTVEIFPEVLAGRHQVDQQRDPIANPIPVADLEFDAHVTRNRGDMRRAIGRCAQGTGRDDRIFKGLAGHDLRGPQVLVNHLDDPPPGTIAHLLTIAMRRRNGRTAGQ